MIAQASVETFTEVAFDGPIGVTASLLLGIVIAFAMLLVLWLERFILGKWWGICFGLLRCIALAAVCWMLLQPSLVERKVSAQSRSVAIVADRSGSMDTVDRLVTPQMLPWIEPDHGQINAADRAAVDLRFAANLIRSHWLESATLSAVASEQYLNRYDFAIKRCQIHLKELVQLSGKRDSMVSDRATSILDEIESIEGDRSKLVVNNESDNETSEIGRYADRIVETLQQQATDLDAVLAKLYRDRVANPPSFTAQSRKEYVGNWLDRMESDNLRELSKTAKIKRASFDSNVHSFTGKKWSAQLAEKSIKEESDSARTDLTAPVGWLGTTATADRLAAVFLISEGGHNADSKLTPVAASRSLGDVPIIGVGIGNSVRSRDLVLHQVNVPRVVTENDDIKIEAIVSAYDCDGTFTEVILKQGAQEVERRTVSVDSSLSDTRLQFRVPAGKPGLREFQISVEPVEGEVSQKNNYSAFSVETIRGKTRVLLADLQTRWEYRYLQILFARDTQVNADEFLRMPNPHATGQIAALGRLPETVDEWAQYDVVLLGDLELSRASQNSLEEFVRKRAGKLVVIAGKNHMPANYFESPFFDLLPIQSRQQPSLPLDPYVAVSQEGMSHPAMQIEKSPHASRNRWKLATSRASLGYVSPWTVPRDSARVLATIESASEMSSPAEGSSANAWLCWHKVGSGSVVYITSPAVYKLRFRGGDTYHHRFWGQMLRWLMSSDIGSDELLVQLRTDKSNYVQGDTVQATLQIRNRVGLPVSGDDVSLSIATNRGVPRSVAMSEDENLPGTYRAEIRDLDPEVYQIRPLGPSIDRLYADNPEMKPTQVLVTVEQVGDVEHMLTSANYPLMAEIAAASGGQLVTPAGAEEVLSLLPVEEQVKSVEERTPIWNRWPMLWLVACCLSTEWVIRKMKGLV